MSNLSICGFNNATANSPFAWTVMEKFCSCPAAKETIAEILNTVPVFKVNEIDQVKTMTTVVNGILTGEKTGIIEVTNLADPLANMLRLSTQIFYPFYDAIHESIGRKAENGTMALNKWTNLKSSVEFLMKKKEVELRKACYNEWGMPKKHMWSFDFPLSKKNYRWLQEVECETDKLRSTWLKSYKGPFCAKNEEHPDCKNVPVLCDFDALQNIPWEERQARWMERARARLDQASPSLRKWAEEMIKRSDAKAKSSQKPVENLEL